MKRCFWLIFVIVMRILFPPCTSAQQTQTSASECKEWFAMVDASKGASGFGLAPPLSDDRVLKGIDCLLLLRGNKRLARFTGATHFEVSQLLPQASVELAALYYISYLFTRHWQHGDGIALWGQHGVINPDGSVEVAYRAYAAWFKRVQAIGLQEAREQRLNPLKGTRLAWFGNVAQ